MYPRKTIQITSEEAYRFGILPFLADRRTELFTKKVEVAIVVARCTSTKAEFGIRFERLKKRWVADWSFFLRPGTATREGYEETRLNGQFEFAKSYPGCPGCENGSIFLCSCGRVGCWNGRSRTVTCPWCEHQVKLESEIKDLLAGQDR